MDSGRGRSIAIILVVSPNQATDSGGPQFPFSQLKYPEGNCFTFDIFVLLSSDPLEARAFPLDAQSFALADHWFH